MSDSSALAPICPRCGFGEFITLPGRAPRCKRCDAVVGLAPRELVPPKPKQSRKVTQPSTQRTPAQQAAYRRSQQEALHMPERWHEKRPVSEVRERMDVRLNETMRRQMNALVARRQVTATEIIRVAVESLYRAEIEDVGDY